MNKFHEHLDGCTQCRERPMDLCAIGAQLLVEAAKEPPPDFVFSLTGRLPKDPCPACDMGIPTQKRGFVLLKERDKREGAVLNIDYSAIEMRVMAQVAADEAKKAAEATRPDPEYLCASCGCEDNTTMDKPCGVCGSVRVALFSALKPHLGPDWRNYFE